jgi:hypothetical protein
MDRPGDAADDTWALLAGPPDEVIDIEHNRCTPRGHCKIGWLSLDNGRQA